MSETNQLQHCDRCGAVLSGYGADRLCAACLLESALLEPNTPAGPRASAAPLLAFNDYELLEEIARGGMGVVYRARQLSLNRPVAVKLMLGGHLANTAGMQRFRVEAETAAQLHHPNIVAIHEVGEHEGQPFFSMELVAGRNLAQVVRDEPLPSRKAAAWLKTIAEAVQYAHSRGVLHRDLKPSNILIDENDQPRITDFGLAKRLNDSQLSTPDPQLTLTGQVLGSPSFIPPEQAAGQKDAIGPASDVYSLGAILYHLLTGRPPFVAETMTATLRMVAETEPVSPRLLNTSVPRDLETICLKCLEKEPSRRYLTAQALAEDLNRFLRNEPILARPAGVGLKVHRWCLRNKPLAIAGTALLALLLVVAIGSPIAALRINRERQQAESNGRRAQIEAAKSRRVASFLEDMLLSAGPSVARGRDATIIREILEKTSEDVGRKFKDLPEVRGDIWLELGFAYVDIGDHPRAITNLEKAVASYRLAFPGDHKHLALALGQLGSCQSFTGNITNGHYHAGLGLEMARKCGDKEVLLSCLRLYALSFKAWGVSSIEGAPFLREASELRKQLGDDPVGIADSIADLAGSLTNHEEVLKLTQEALALYRKNLPSDHPHVVGQVFSLGQWFMFNGRFAEAEQALREALQGFRKIHDPNQPYQPIVLRFLAESLLVQGKGVEAEDLVRQQLTATPANKRYEDLLRRVVAFRSDWAPDDEIFQYLKGDFLLWDVADRLAKQDDQAEVERLLREGLRKQRERYGPESPNLSGPIRRLADWCVKKGQKEEAESLYCEALEIKRKVLGNEHLDVAKSLHDLAGFLQSQDKLADAERLYREELAIRRKLQGDNDLDVAEALRGVAWMLQRQDNLPAAESSVREALAIRRKLLDPKDPGVAEVLRDLRGLLLQQGKLDDVELSDLDDPDFVARRGRWKEAAARYWQRIESAPDDWGPYVRLAPILLLQGDVDSYSRLCRQAATRFLGTNDAGTADNVAKACSLDPRAGVNLDTIAQAAETAVTLGKDSELFPWFALCKSLAEYRQRHFAGAIDWAQKSLAAAGPVLERDAAAYLVLAMAQTELKQTTAARNSFEKGCDIVEHKLPKLDSADLGDGWHDGMIANLLLREARTRIKENSEPVTDPAKAARP
jgi:tetratricopeptide (TPR) repeat protein